MNRLAAIAVAVSLVAVPLGPSSAASHHDRTSSCAAPCAVPVAAIQAELDAAIDTGVPGIVWLVRNGNNTVVLTAGTADIATGRLTRPDDRFRAASISKMFVATVILQLVQEHRLHLDDPLDKWLPGVVTDRNITVRELLQHTSGLFDFGDDENFIATVIANPTRTWKPEELLAVAAAHPPYFAPGTGYHYSNTGYVLLGILIQRITGRPESSEVARRILRPLHLRHTYVSDQSTIRGRHANGYTTDAAGNPLDVTTLNATFTGASGDIISTVTDIATFQRALLAGHLLDRRALAEMETFIPTNDEPATAVGLGLFATPQACGTSYGHSGGIFGYQSDAQQMADGRRQNVVFTNTDSIPEDAYQHFAAATNLSLCATTTTNR